MAPDYTTDVPADTVQPASVMRSTAATWAGVVLSLLTLITWVAFDVYDDRAVIIKNEQDRLLTQARVIETNLEHQTASVARVLRTLATAPLDGGMNRRLSELCQAMPGIRTLLFLDRSGRVVASNRQEILRRDFSGRDYFSIPRKQQRLETLYVSPPFTTVTGKFVINLSVMIPGRDGSFNGVVGATLNPDYFAVLLRSVHYTSSGMWSSIVHGDGLMFIMIPETAGAQVTSVAVPGTFYTRHITSGKGENVFSGTSGISGTRRIIAMKTFNPSGLQLSKPLIIAVSRDAAAVLADWRRESLFKGLAILLLTGFISLGTLYLLRRKRFFEQQELQLLEQQVATRHETRMAQESQKNNALIQAILESTSSAIFSLDTSFCYTTFNHAHAKFMKALYGADIEKGAACWTT
ncbi:MAG: hypothetical protein IPQ16_02710 [Geobacteraceae bacterium]|nr:hypothetical protein [Geobacteraceae bacterium]